MSLGPDGQDRGFIAEPSVLTLYLPSVVGAGGRLWWRSCEFCVVFRLSSLSLFVFVFVFVCVCVCVCRVFMICTGGATGTGLFRDVGECNE